MMNTPMTAAEYYGIIDNQRQNNDEEIQKMEGAIYKSINSIFR